ncbi:hypothetical protein HHK36_004774 [Tetracentron sinense]|uniref:BHLH domain-containing protein n=1 Tax=Tetracentron sinense TaxID=13715 RepID=A0A834ZJQ3_TETSI|nr:hypothetical protein HHK36_004774 [Tetracentron sinense]
MLGRTGGLTFVLSSRAVWLSTIAAGVEAFCSKSPARDILRKGQEFAFGKLVVGNINFDELTQIFSYHFTHLNSLVLRWTRSISVADENLKRIKPFARSTTPTGVLLFQALSIIFFAAPKLKGRSDKNRPIILKRHSAKPTESREGAMVMGTFGFRMNMNHCVPDWYMEDDLLPVANQNKSTGPDHEFVELLWQNGQVVLHSQTNRKPGHMPNEVRQIQKPDQPTLRGGGSFGSSSNLTREDETASWIQYPHNDSLVKEFCSDFLYDLSTTGPIGVNKPIRQLEEEKYVKFGASEPTIRSQQPIFKQSCNLSSSEIPMPPPRLQIPDEAVKNQILGLSGRVVNFSHFSRPVMADLASSNGPIQGKGSNNMVGGEVGESSVMTVGSSHCGSNQVPNETDLSRASSNGVGAAGVSVMRPIKEDVQKMFLQCERTKMGTLEPTVTSSSGGSGGSSGKTSKHTTGTNSHKRKDRNADESECQSEDAQYESAEPKKQSQRSGSARKSRAAEVHNLSERRRRDRINEKMKALQELIPHCNKIMWMGSGMAPMMFPGVQNYMSRMGMGMGPPHLPSIHSPMHLPRVPLVDQAISGAPAPNQPTMCQNPVVNPVNFQNQMQNPDFAEQYARYMGFHHMQTAPQPMNMFNYGSQTVQQSHKLDPSSGSAGPINGVPTDKTTNGKLG